MKLGRLILVEVILIAVVALAAGGVYYAYWQGQHYVRSSDAQIGGNLVTVVAPAAGEVTGALPQLGEKEQAGATLLTIRALGSQATAAGKTVPVAQDVPVKAPATGRMAVLDIVPGQYVTAGEPLGELVAFTGNTVTAYIPETKVHAVRVGQYVDVYIDAYPNDTFPGRVAAIVPATQASLSLLPSTQSSGSFTKVTQRVPVVIRFQNPGGAQLYMGLSVEVRVHVSGNP